MRSLEARRDVSERRQAARGGRSGKIWAALPFLALGAWALGAGCENTAGDCELTAECTGAPGVTASCEPSKAKGPVAASCGTFVSASAPAGGDGSRDKPFATIGEAVSAVKDASPARIYACAETFGEEVVLPGGVELYGGLDCKKDWVYSEAGRTTIAPASGVPITFVSGKATHVENVRAMAPDGAKPDGSGANGRSGGASIAAIAEASSTVNLVRCELTAGDGADGIGADELSPVTAAPSGKTGTNACASGQGAASVVHACIDLVSQTGIETSGGRGGDGAAVDPSNGALGGSGPSPGSAGQPQTDADACSAGGDGGDGTDGDPGTGGHTAMSLVDGSHKGAPGTDGKPGTSGSGGGGGGGGKGCVSSGTPGPGGGSGGAGGCAGEAGKGGGAGGSSIALLAVDATVTLESVVLVAGRAGDGAPGTAGQKGGAGGEAGPSGLGSSIDSANACAGGKGGRGGDGGPGGGGEGGHSIAAVWKSGPSSAQGVTFTAGVAGKGGPGGAGAESMAAGDDGQSCQAFDVSKGQCVTP